MNSAILDAAMILDALSSGAQQKMKCIVQDALAACSSNLLGSETFHCSCSCNWHKRWSFESSVRRCDTTSTSMYSNCRSATMRDLKSKRVRPHHESLRCRVASRKVRRSDSLSAPNPPDRTLSKIRSISALDGPRPSTNPARCTLRAE